VEFVISELLLGFRSASGPFASLHDFPPTRGNSNRVFRVKQTGRFHHGKLPKPGSDANLPARSVKLRYVSYSFHCSAPSLNAIYDVEFSDVVKGHQVEASRGYSFPVWYSFCLQTRSVAQKNEFVVRIGKVKKMSDWLKEFRAWQVFGLVGIGLLAIAIVLIFVRQLVGFDG